jgi:hypothetical protein
LRLPTSYPAEPVCSALFGKVNIASKMGDALVSVYQTFWVNKLYTLKSEYQALVQQYPEADSQLKQFPDTLFCPDSSVFHPNFVPPFIVYQ